ncbi:MAG: MarR family transcriptional regulator, partial [Oceanisphaera sp.]|nr:MarR family transcriptional regulator [Oceanisphaera sp.]
MEKHEEVLVALRQIIRAIDLHSRQLSKASGLTGPQLLLL